MDKKKVLCVEDDTDIQLLLKLGLDRFGGFDVLIASSGEEALEIVESFRPDILLLDFMLPGMSGLEFCQRVHALPGFEETPAVLITARVSGQLPADWSHAPVVGVLPKPFDPMTLAEELRRYL